MPKIDLKYKLLDADENKYGKGYVLNSLTKKQFESFNKNVLGLGDLEADGQYVNGMAVFFDLQGFADFANQVDSHLVIPEFINKYTTWLFKQISDLFKEGEYDDHVKVWGKLPFYAKFLGDGILLLWNTDSSHGFTEIVNIVDRLYRVTKSYKTLFLPYIQKSVSKPPASLRCGIARGQIISLGNGEDYVGSCINMAARLQKISLLSFAISRRCFDLFKVPGMETLKKELVLKKYKVRGIGDDELLYVIAKEFNELPKDEKAQFTNA